VKARARVVAEYGGHRRTRLTSLRSEAPLVLRATPGALYLVGGAGGPLGGDDLTLEIEVGAGARLTVRTAAASVALPGSGPSQVRVRATVGEGGELRWLPEPLVAAQACHHHMEVELALEEGARLEWREEVVLGRHGEEGGSVLSRQTVDLGGAPLLRQELALGPRYPAAASPAVTGGARAVASLVVVDGRRPAPPAPVVLGPTAAVLPLVRCGVQVVAAADGAADVRRLLEAGTAAHRWGVAVP
jgi:urease accessory protein